MYETIKLEKKDHIATLTLNRPERLNAFTPTMLDEVSHAWQDIRYDDDVHVVVLTGAGRAFCSGVDRAQSITDTPNVWNREDAGRRKLGPKSNSCWKPVVLAVNGLAAGGAFYFLNEADIVICSENATFFDPHLTYHLASTCEPIGALARMPYSEVMRMVLLGNHERIGPDRALALGLVSDVLPQDGLMDEAHSLAAKIAEASPRAVQGSVRGVWTALHSVWAGGLDHAIVYPTIGNDPEAVAEGVAKLKSGKRLEYRVR
ncbi:enoyl-CoA hydratase/isomerase family protein [Amycolatopsis thermophila]|uniref:Enoyl-CoA hydratase/carnithine racemase n=1 Tax=Amycolatopsis thermophila TaxID=206084 RepID=A0ABU0F568_9PSEU|nr:enoyl-CoA hydratase/isomerase family protein [Amycolatopsis thermophila]MDQ0382727.1 enoyl-CoA hydratase/carnithine racemase [Amycolatopsis thermophila]